MDGTTLGEFVSTFNVRPIAGSLVDVEGKVLRPRAFPGKLLLNGNPASPGTRLQTDDRIIVIRGRDRREPLSQEIMRVPKGMPSNPQFFLARTPGDQVVFRGAVSHKLVLARAWHRTTPLGGGRARAARLGKTDSKARPPPSREVPVTTPTVPVRPRQLDWSVAEQQRLEQIKTSLRLPEPLVELTARRFRGIGEPMRIRLLDRLREGEAGVNELSSLLGASQQNVSHLGLLVEAGIVARRREGTHVL